MDLRNVNKLYDYKAFTQLTNSKIKPSEQHNSKPL